MRAAVIGDGGWGTALACALRRNGHAVRLWGPFPDYIAQLQSQRENTRYLPGVPLPEGLEWTADPADAVRGADLVVLAVPSAYVRDVMARFAPHLPAGARRVSVTKGLDPRTLQRMTALAGEILGGGPVAALSGPQLRRRSRARPARRRRRRLPRSGPGRIRAGRVQPRTVPGVHLR
jgi:glycerol-3-phosphate dehydrogenase (NAD(P)+)